MDLSDPDVARFFLNHVSISGNRMPDSSDAERKHLQIQSEKLNISGDKRGRVFNSGFSRVDLHSTFAPRITSLGKKLVPVSAVHLRLTEDAMKRRAKSVRLREEAEFKAALDELRNCTFLPIINDVRPSKMDLQNVFDRLASTRSPIIESHNGFCSDNQKAYNPMVFLRRMTKFTEQKRLNTLALSEKINRFETAKMSRKSELLTSKSPPFFHRLQISVHKMRVQTTEHFISNSKHLHSTKTKC